MTELNAPGANGTNLTPSPPGPGSEPGVLPCPVMVIVPESVLSLARSSTTPAPSPVAFDIPGPAIPSRVMFPDPVLTTVSKPAPTPIPAVGPLNPACPRATTLPPGPPPNGVVSMVAAINCTAFGVPWSGGTATRNSWPRARPLTGSPPPNMRTLPPLVRISTRCRYERITDNDRADTGPSESLFKSS